MDYPQLTFEKADKETFKNLDLAYKAMEMEGTAACILNAANEIAVDAFLKEKISFLDISRINEETLNNCLCKDNPAYEDYVASDEEAREYASKLVKLIVH